MAQVLKEIQRDKILEAAKQELLQYGYRDASMRRIAAQAKMTVGNLYRYFESKDQLIQAITSPALTQLDQLVRSLTDDRISLNQTNTAVGLSIGELRPKIDRLALDLAELSVRMPQEMRILMLHTMSAENRFQAGLFPYWKCWLKSGRCFHSTGTLSFTRCAGCFPRRCFKACAKSFPKLANWIKTSFARCCGFTSVCF